MYKIEIFIDAVFFVDMKFYFHIEVFHFFRNFADVERVQFCLYSIGVREFSLEIIMVGACFAV